MRPPPYYGVRITWWRQGKFGWGFELTHDKIYANDEALANAGVRYDLKGDWDLIGEYQGTYSLNDVRLHDGGHFSTNIVTNALNIGVTKDF